MARVVGQVRSPQMGTIATLLAEDGAAVEAGQEILEIEAMKMFNLVETDTGGIVRYRCEVGEVVNEGDLLAEIEEA